jgi:hypothetical protein
MKYNCKGCDRVLDEEALTSSGYCESCKENRKDKPRRE